MILSDLERRDARGRIFLADLDTFIPFDLEQKPRRPTFGEVTCMGIFLRGQPCPHSNWRAEFQGSRVPKKIGTPYLRQG